MKECKLQFKNLVHRLIKYFSLWNGRKRAKKISNIIIIEFLSLHPPVKKLLRYLSPKRNYVQKYVFIHNLLKLEKQLLLEKVPEGQLSNWKIRSCFSVIIDPYILVVKEKYVNFFCLIMAIGQMR